MGSNFSVISPKTKYNNKVTLGWLKQNLQLLRIYKARNSLQKSAHKNTKIFQLTPTSLRVKNYTFKSKKLYLYTKSLEETNTLRVKNSLNSFVSRTNTLKNPSLWNFYAFFINKISKNILLKFLKNSNKKQYHLKTKTMRIFFNRIFLKNQNTTGKLTELPVKQPSSSKNFNSYDLAKKKTNTIYYNLPFLLKLCSLPKIVKGLFDKDVRVSNNFAKN